MKWFLWLFGSSLVIILSLYARAYWVASKITYDFAGLATPDNVGELFKDFFGSLNFKIKVNNPTIFGVSIKNLNLTILNKAGKVIYKIDPIKSVKIKPTSSTEVIVSSDVVNLANAQSDALAGKQEGYKYEASGRLYGFLPFKVRGMVFEW